MQFIPLLRCGRTLAVVISLWPVWACGSSGESPRPDIVVVAPDNGDVVSSPEVELRFRVEDAAATGYSVKVNDAPREDIVRAIRVDEEVAHPVTLSVGVNEIVLSARDEAGETEATSLVVVVTLPPVVRPELVIAAPENGAVVNEASVDLAFHVVATSALGHRITVDDGTPVEVAQAIPVGQTITRSVALEEGVNTITLEVLDAAGVADAETRVVVVDLVPSPTVVIDAPSEAVFVYDDTYVVSGRIVTSHPVTARYAQNGGGTTALTLTPTIEGYAFSFSADLAIGANTIVVTATNDLGEEGTATAAISREVDTEPPTITVTFPREGHAVKTARVLVRGTTADADAVDVVFITIGAETFPAVLDQDGSFRAFVDLVPASNAYTIHAIDRAGNERALPRTVYFGQQLGAGGAFGGAIRNGEIYTWGRNNLGQTGLDYVSHESRTAWCERTLPNPSFEATVCKATSVTSIHALCDGALGAGTVEALACRSTTTTERDAVCLAAGSSAPTNCVSSASANLVTACEAAYGVGTTTANACKVRLVCEAAYAAGTEARATCASTVVSVPSTFPSPATPYSATRITQYSTTATPAAATGTGQPFASLGVTFTSLSFNQNAASALDSAGDVWSFGDGANGMLCLGDAITDVDANDRKIPHRVAPFGAPGTRAIAISRGYDHLLVLRSDGSVWGCGVNTLGQLGDGTFGAANNRALPTHVVGLPTNVVQVVASAASSYALTADGLVYAWGRNQYGNLGQGTTSTATAAQASPLLVPGLTDVVMLATGRDHVLAARADGHVWAWGLNASHQVGPGTSPVTSPMRVEAIDEAFAVYANANQGFYEDAAGRLWGWGQNGSGNLGIPDDEDQETPNTAVFGIDGTTDVAIGALHGFVMRGDVVFAWGWSFHGSLGAGPSTIHTWPYRTPILVQFP